MMIADKKENNKPMQYNKFIFVHIMKTYRYK